MPRSGDPQGDVPDLQTLRQKLADTRQEVRNLIVMGMRSNLTPEKAELIRNLERSARAEAKLRHRHLEAVQGIRPPAATAACASTASVGWRAQSTASCARI
jgi:hypothetical protein